MATAAIINALWDLWGKLEGKPVWRLLADLEPEVLLSVIDFRYVTNCVTKAEALELLKQGQVGKEERIQQLIAKGYPCYTTQAGKFWGITLENTIFNCLFEINGEKKELWRRKKVQKNFFIIIRALTLKPENLLKIASPLGTFF